MGLRAWIRGRWEQRSNSRALGAGFVPPAPVLSGTYVTPQTALGLSAYYAAVNVISRDVASLPLNVYRKLPGGGREIDERHPYQDLFAVESDENTSATKFSLDSQGHTLGWGNGYAEVVRDPRGRATALCIMHPSKTLPKLDTGGRLYYQDELTHEKYLSENVLHFAGLGFNGVTGYTPAYIARQGIGLGIAAEQLGASLFGNGLIPKGVLKTSRVLSPTARTNLRTSLGEIHQGSQSAHQLLILEEGLDYQATQINPDDAQFLATRQFQVLEIARLFGLPPHKLQDYSQAHLANVEESNLDYLFSTLAFWCFVRERELNRKLLTRADRQRWVIAYDFSALLRGNSGARVQYYTAMRNMGCLSADDIRKAEGMNPLGAGSGGDKYLVQMQYQPLAQAGELPKPAAPPAPGGKPEEPAGGDEAAADRAARRRAARRREIRQAARQAARREIQRAARQAAVTQATSGQAAPHDVIWDRALGELPPAGGVSNGNGNGQI